MAKYEGTNSRKKNSKIKWIDPNTIIDREIGVGNVESLILKRKNNLHENTEKKLTKNKRLVIFENKKNQKVPVNFLLRRYWLLGKSEKKLLHLFLETTCINCPLLLSVLDNFRVFTPLLYSIRIWRLLSSDFYWHIPHLPGHQGLFLICFLFIRTFWEHSEMQFSSSVINESVAYILCSFVSGRKLKYFMKRF